MARDVGRMGETLLMQWAAQAGIIVNKSDNQDAAGWDFFLEWPHAAVHGASQRLVPLDRSPAPYQCLLQVKATDRKLTSWPVKLSNWLRFVQTGLPAFFLVVEFAGADQCERAFLVHVDETWIRRVLRRLRELSSAGSEAKLHQRSLALKWGDDDELASLSGAGLDRALREYLSGGMEQYTRRKLDMIQTTGYEQETSRMNVTVRPPEGWTGDAEDLLVHFLLGIVPSLELEGGEMVDVRFGIPSTESIRHLPAGARLIADPKPVGQGRIRLRAPSIDREVVLTADTILPRGAPGVISDNRVVARFAVPFVDFVFPLRDSSRLNFKLRLPSQDSRHLLADLRPSADLLLLLDAAWEAGSGVTVEMWFQEHPLGTGHMTVATPPARPLIEWATLVRQTWTVAKHFELQQEMKVSLADLARQRGALLVLSTVLGPDASSIRVEFKLNQPPAEPEKPFCMLIAAQAYLGGFWIQLVVAAVGEAKRTGGIEDGREAYCLETRDVRRVRERVFREPERPQVTLEELRDAVAMEFDETMNVLLWTE